MLLDKSRLRLSRRLWSLGEPGLFCFSPGASPALMLESADDGGRKRMARHLSRLQKAGERRVVSGTVLLDAQARPVLCSPRMTPKILAAVAKWATAEVGSIPALAGLYGAGAVAAEVELTADLGALTVHRDPALWSGLIRADAATIAAVLGAVLPGQRLWFWLWPGSPTLPLLLQPLSQDPNTDRLTLLIEQVDPDKKADPVSGVAIAIDGGGLQLVSPDLTPDHLPAVAAWARQAVGDHPALARLCDLQLVQTTPAGTVTAIHTAPDLWADLPRYSAPGTLARTAEVLSGLEPGQGAWFWMTKDSRLGAFLSLAPRQDDPDGTAFQEQVLGLSRRFSGSASLSGTLQRLQSGRLVFSTNQTDTATWPTVLAGLLEHPDLSDLSGASLLQLSDGQITGALALR